MSLVVADLFDDDFRIRPKKHFRKFRSQSVFDGISHFHRPDGGNEFQSWDAVMMRGAGGVEGDDRRLSFDDDDHRRDAGSSPNAV